MLFALIGEALDYIVCRNNSQLSGLTQIGDTLFIIPKEYMGQPTVKVSVGKVMIQVNSLVIINQCSPIVFQL